MYQPLIESQGVAQVFCAADLLERPCRGVAAVAPGLQRVLQAAVLRVSSAVIFSAVPALRGSWHFLRGSRKDMGMNEGGG